VNVVTVPSVSVTVTTTLPVSDGVVQVTTSPPTGDVNVPESCCRPSVPKTLSVSCLASAV
jgi:hypothetical protein